MPPALLPDAPAVSVVIAAYNAVDFIGETIESVLRQTYRDFEVIVVNDGSTDETGALVEGLGAPVRCIHQENKGQPAARNRGIRAARGRYVAFLDADDLWLPEKLARQMRVLQQTERAWCYADAYRFDSATGQVTGRAGQEHRLREGDVLRPLLLGNFIPSPTPVVRRDVFEAAGFFCEEPFVRGGGGEDWDMWLRIAARYPVAFVSVPLAKRRVHAQSMTGAMDLERTLKSRLRVVRRALRRTPECTAGLRGRAEAQVWTTVGRWALGRGERRRARDFLAQALRRHPAGRVAWGYFLATFLPGRLRRALGRLRTEWRRVRQEGR